MQLHYITPLRERKPNILVVALYGEQHASCVVTHGDGGYTWIPSMIEFVHVVDEQILKDSKIDC